MGTQNKKHYKWLSADNLLVAGTNITDSIDELAALNGLTASTDELNILDNQVGSATFTPAAEDNDTITVAIQLVDAAGVAMATRCAIHFYLSDDADGDTIVAAATSLVAGADGVMIEAVSNSAGLLISEVDGDIDIVIGDASGAASYYIVLIMPNGSLVVSDEIVFAA
jgi:hypothetical protein